MNCHASLTETTTSSSFSFQFGQGPQAEIEEDDTKALEEAFLRPYIHQHICVVIPSCCERARYYWELT